MRQSVLVVEESWHVANAMKSYLESLGMVVSVAGKLEHAERLTAEQTSELVLVDINLRDETTYELLERLKPQGVPVIALSAYPVAQASAPSAWRGLLAALTRVYSR